MMSNSLNQWKSIVFRFAMVISIVSPLFVGTAFRHIDITEPSIIRIESSLDTPGIIYASKVIWSSNNNVVYFRGRHIRIKDGANNLKANGSIDYLGVVPYLVFQHSEMPKDTEIDIEGKKCSVVKLSKEDAIKKYGSKGNKGAVEITIVN